MTNRLLFWPLLALTILLVGGCSEDRKDNPVAPAAPPAAPRGLFSVTGDHQVRLVWLSNTEPDVVGYRVFKAPCSDCDYVAIATVPATSQPYVSYVVTGLENGQTRYYAVDAVDGAGTFSDLSYNDVFDTPRPAGTGLVLNNFRIPGAHDFGYDFSAYARTDSLGTPSDIYYGFYEDALGYPYHQIFVPDDTDIQDAGYAGSGPPFSTPLDQVDFADSLGWSPSKVVEAVVGHNYVVWTWDNHFAKFRVVAVDGASVTLDWAYQTDAGNPELRARPAVRDGQRRSPGLARLLR